MTWEQGAWTYVTIFCFGFQGLCIFSDELFFHRKRLLPRWELIGHPVDTFFLCAFFFALRFGPPGDERARILTISLGVVSSLIITKDEWVHKRLASGAENWLHALLFLVHPVVIGLFWFGWRSGHKEFGSILNTAQIMTGLFLLYQIAEGVRRWSRANIRAGMR